MISAAQIALADLLVTPVNSSFVDLDLIGRFHPVTNRLLGPGCFAAMVGELRAARLDAGMPALDWLVLQNRQRQDNSRNRGKVDRALARLAAQCDFRLGAGLAERVAYRELFPLGLTHIDLRRIPEFARAKVAVAGEVMHLLDELELDLESNGLLAGAMVLPLGQPAYSSHLG
jgi:chromosome partitioning protein